MSLRDLDTDALVRFADSMLGLLETEMMAADGGHAGAIEVAALWEQQANLELALRFAEERGELDDQPHASREEIADERGADDWAKHAE